MTIVIFGGTSEGRLLSEALAGGSLKLHICVATDYGASLLPKAGNLQIHTGRMEEREMEAFLAKTAPAYCLDATHPYASQVTANICKACEKRGVPYIRVYRQEEKGGDYQSVQSIEQAAEFLKHTEGNILITTGSKELEKYTLIPSYETRCFVRVLPAASVLEKCRELGFSGKNIIAMQGPFGEELNYALLKQTNSAFLVTKNSGREGGYQEKCEAALRAGAALLVVERPGEPAPSKAMSLSEAAAFLQSMEKEKKAPGRFLSLVGMGPGNPSLLTGEALAALEKSDVWIGAGRMLDIAAAALSREKGKPVFSCYEKEKILRFLREHREYQRAAVLYSGDPGFYSGAKGTAALFSEFETEEISGISSPLYFLNKLGVPWEDVRLVSCHGQQTDLLSLIREQKKVCALLGKRTQIGEISKKLIEAHMEHIKITVGERLSYPEERILSGSPEDMEGREFDTLSVALFENPSPLAKRVWAGIGDEAFLRGGAPMTKEEIRTLSLSKLRLREDSILYDVGAGTGSVSVEAALLCQRGQVYAIEKKPEAAALIGENRARFQAENLTVIQGEAPECLRDLPAPTHVFIGGSGGKLEAIVEAVREKNPGARFVANGVTLETMTALWGLKERYPEYEELEAVQVNVARSRLLGSYHFLKGENPVMIVSFGKGGQDER